MPPVRSWQCRRSLYSFRSSSAWNGFQPEPEVRHPQLKADTYISVASIIDEELQAFTKKNETNPYYIQLLKVKMDKYFGKKNVTNVKECLKEGTVYGPLCAYRLFYVGCSRAKRNLVIMINKKDIEDFEDKLRNKLMITGFNVL